MSEEINFIERYDEILDIKPTYGIDRIKKPVKFDYIGLEIEISINYERERYTFIRALIKKIKALVGNKGYFVKDGTIIGDYSFEIILDPLPISKIKKIYAKLIEIIKFSDGSIVFDKEKNCGLHMNFNQYDVEDLNESHKRMLLLMEDKTHLFDENVYKQVVHKFDFEQYLNFQKTVSSKYVAINYLNKKLVEIRNIKVGLSSKQLELVMIDLIDALYFQKLKKKKSNNNRDKLLNIMDDMFEKNNVQLIKDSLENDVLIIKFNKNKPKIVIPNQKIIESIKEE